MLKGFKDFILRGNVVDLAVAVVIGAAFATIVSAFTEKIIQPLTAPAWASRWSPASPAPTSTSRR